MASDDNYPNPVLMRDEARVTEEAKTWSIGPRILWGVYLALGALAMLLGIVGHIPSTGRYGGTDMQITTLANFVRSILGI
jgi:hypothetical protein